MRPHWLACLAAALAVGAPAAGARTEGGTRADPPVTLEEDDATFTLSNGRVTARIDKRAGAITALKYQGLNLMSRGYWSQVGRSGTGSIDQFGSKRTSSVRIDPKKTGGERAEVSCRFVHDGKSPGLPADVELRYTLGRGDSGPYAWAVWEHRPGTPGFSVGEGRMAFKLNPDVFDYLTSDADRRRVMPTGVDWDRGEPLNMKEARRMTTGIHKGEPEHKYDYSAMLPQTPAYGWSSTKHHVGLWLINPNAEYLSGGPTKVELTGHLDVNPGGLPTLLNMWHGSHYGGSTLVVGEQEAWVKVIGPFFIYCNAADDHDTMWKDALAKAKREQEAWPYGWVDDPNYPPASGRGTVKGQVVVADPQAPNLVVRNLWVGLAHPSVDWQKDSKYYQFWARADAGDFVVRHVRPGRYTPYAFADGVLGEFSRADVTVEAGKTLDLGRLEWEPVRHGRQLWEIGVPDRSAAEFRHGDHYWRWGLYYEYPKEFPDDVNFVVGKSDPRKDWNYCQPPRIDGDRVRSTTWTITFDLPEAPRGKATLRLAIAGSRAPRGVEVLVNDAAAGGTGPLPDTGVMHRDGIRGYWCERGVAFDAALLKRGTNTIKLRVPATSWVNGVLYDYLRLELEEK
jgi:rhamnogalacturonan endolyase